MTVLAALVWAAVLAAPSLFALSSRVRWLQVPPGSSLLPVGPHPRRQ